MKRLLLLLGCAGSLSLPLLLLLMVVGMIFVGGVQGSAPGASKPEGAVYGRENEVTLAAKEMAAHLNDSCLGKNADCAGYAAYDAGFPPDILQWGRLHCPGCTAWQADRFQCVSFVLGAYSRLHPLDFSGNGDEFWMLYNSQEAHSHGYRTVPARDGDMPISPGDIMAWSGGKFGHVSIVLGWIKPKDGKNGVITFAGANGQLPIQSLPILPDGRIDTRNGYWDALSVQGYIHPSFLPSSAG
ncbi:MAG: CHAP domain-containing protein [Ktedonobacteraceae bacterium]|nr:CHAP domain-containing protein [Ktedonobacteraceae bacterium]